MLAVRRREPRVPQVGQQGRAGERWGDERGTAETGTDESPRRGERRRATTLVVGGTVALVVVVAMALCGNPPASPGAGSSCTATRCRSRPARLRRALGARPAPTSGCSPAGASPCDALGAMQQDVADPPDVVVIQFVGNNASPCTGARPARS